MSNHQIYRRQLKRQDKNRKFQREVCRLACREAGAEFRSVELGPDVSPSPIGQQIMGTWIDYYPAARSSEERMYDKFQRRRR